LIIYKAEYLKFKGKKIPGKPGIFFMINIIL